MELSKEVHGLLERIKQISQNSGQCELHLSASKNVNRITSDEIVSDLIDVDLIDFTDDERWLYVSESELAQPFEGNLRQWLYKDFPPKSTNVEAENRNETPKKIIDTRTFTRPKKRLSRPSLEHLMHTNRSTDSFNESEPDAVSVQFKLAEPVYNNAFDRILAAATESFDSFQNMEPPSLMNSLCSSTFTNLMDSGYGNQVPNDQDFNLSGSLTENFDPNITDQPHELNTTYCEVRNIIEPSRIESHSYLNEIKYQNTDLNSTYCGLNSKADSNLPLSEIKYKTDLNSGYKSITVDSYLSGMKYQRSDQDLNSTYSTENNREDATEIKYDPNSTYLADNYHKNEQNYELKQSNNQFQTVNDMNSLSKTIEQLNSTFSKSPKIDQNSFSKSDLNRTKSHSYDQRFNTCSKLPNQSKSPDLNHTYQKNINNRVDYLSGTNTITKKSKLGNHLKASCPDINKQLQANNYCVNETYPKLSDSQPNLTEDLKRTILNQSMELMHPTIESYHSARSGSADSLDDRSSSISNSSKDSGKKILNRSDLDSLAKMQEQSLNQVMSTPKPAKSQLLLWETDVLSPIQKRLVDDSDSDLSDSCATTVKSRYSNRSLSTYRIKPPQQRSLGSVVAKPAPEMNVTRPVSQNPEVSLATQRALPTMIVKPMAKRTMVQPSRPLTAPPISAAVRPRVQTSGLPRPLTTTGIPRPQSRIPGPPKTFRAPGSHPNQQKTDWMDGCY